VTLDEIVSVFMSFDELIDKPFNPELDKIGYKSLYILKNLKSGTLYLLVAAIVGPIVSILSKHLVT
jgi:hypothetical protein